MISFIKGLVSIINNEYVVIETNGIGYKVKISPKTLSNLPKVNDEIKIFTHMQVREDDISLYGFLTMEEINMFNLLISVSGIGAKGALSVLSVLSPTDLMLSIISDDIKSISQANGIGKKTSARIILELKDKIKNVTDDEIIVDKTNLTSITDTNKQDAIDALIALGYQKADAFKIVLEVALIDMSVEEIIKSALKKLSNN